MFQRCTLMKNEITRAVHLHRLLSSRKNRIVLTSDVGGHLREYLPCDPVKGSLPAIVYIGRRRPGGMRVISMVGADQRSLCSHIAKRAFGSAKVPKSDLVLETSLVPVTIIVVHLGPANLAPMSLRLTSILGCESP